VDFIPDLSGIELPDPAAAQRALPDLARDALTDGDQGTFVDSVRDETGQVMLQAALTHMVNGSPSAKVGSAMSSTRFSTDPCSASADGSKVWQGCACRWSARVAKYGRS
jgi:hypothetical protein